MKLTKIEYDTALEAATRVEKPALNETQKILTKALELLGPNGEHWLQGEYCNGSRDRFCSVGAVHAARGLAIENGMMHLTEEWMELNGIGGRHGTSFIRGNDKAIHFGEVRAMFLEAIAAAA